jgi:hypothetical protein
MKDALCLPKTPLVGGAGPIARSRLASVPAPHGVGGRVLCGKLVLSLLKIVGDFFSRLMRHKQAVIAVKLD